MRNSDEELSELPKVDYSKLPPELEEAIAKKPYIIARKGKLSWDGKQFSVRIPSEIVEEMRITKEDRIFFKLTKPLPGSEGTPKLEISLIRAV